MKFINYTNKGWGEASYIIELNENEARRIIPMDALGKIQKSKFEVGEEVSLDPVFSRNDKNAEQARALRSILDANEHAKELFAKAEGEVQG